MSAQRLAISNLIRHGQRFFSLPHPVPTNEPQETPTPAFPRFSDVVLPLVSSFNNVPLSLQFSTILGHSHWVPSLVVSSTGQFSGHTPQVDGDFLPCFCRIGKPDVTEVGVQTDDCFTYSTKTDDPVVNEEKARWDLENLIGEELLKAGETRAAIRRFQAAASHGNANAINNLAECLFSGIGTVCNKEKAFSLWEQAVQLGHVNAMYSLAVCLIRAATAGEPKGDKLRAFRLMRTAAVEGNVHAAFYLVVRYIRDSDLESAKDVIRIAARDEGYASEMKSWTEGNFLDGKCFQLVKQVLVDSVF